MELLTCVKVASHQGVKLGQRVFDIKYFLIERERLGLDVEGELGHRNEIRGSCGVVIRMTGLMGSNGHERAVDTQWSSLSAQGTGVGALEVPEYAVSIGDEIGRHLHRASDRTAESWAIHTGGDFSKRVIFHRSLTSPMLKAARAEAKESSTESVPVE